MLLGVLVGGVGEEAEPGTPRLFGRTLRGSRDSKIGEG